MALLKSLLNKQNQTLSTDLWSPGQELLCQTLCWWSFVICVIMQAVGGGDLNMNIFQSMEE